MTACHDLRNHPKTGSLTLVEIHRIQITVANRNIGREYHLKINKCREKKTLMLAQNIENTAESKQVQVFSYLHIILKAFSFMNAMTFKNT